MALSTTKKVDRCCADRAPGFRPVVGVGLVLVEPGGWLYRRQSPEFAPVRLREPMAGKRQGKKAREGCGQHGPSPLDVCPPSATVAGCRAGTQETGGCEASGLTGMSRRAASANVEAACGLHLTWGLKVLGVEFLRQGLKPGRAGTTPAARCGARKPARSAGGAPRENDRPTMTPLPALDYAEAARGTEPLALAVENNAVAGGRNVTMTMRRTGLRGTRPGMACVLRCLPARPASPTALLECRPEERTVITHAFASRY